MSYAMWDVAVPNIFCSIKENTKFTEKIDLMLINMNQYNDISVNFGTCTKQIRNLYAAIEYVSTCNTVKCEFTVQL